MPRAQQPEALGGRGARGWTGGEGGGAAGEEARAEGCSPERASEGKCEGREAWAQPFLSHKRRQRAHQSCPAPAPAAAPPPLCPARTGGSRASEDPGRAAAAAAGSRARLASLGARGGRRAPRAAGRSGAGEGPRAPRALGAPRSCPPALIPGCSDVP